MLRFSDRGRKGLGGWRACFRALACAAGDGGRGLAILSWVCFLRVGEAAGIRVSHLALAGFVGVWNSKTGDEGYTPRPLCRYADGVRPWLHRHMVSLGRSSDMLVWQSGEAGPQACMAEALAGTAYAHAKWHALRRGGAAASWARKPDLTYYKWWGR